MCRLHRVIAFLLAVLWLPAVWHCGLETIVSAAEERGCCTHDSDETTASEGACVADHCAIFDEGHFKVDDEGSLVLPEPGLWLGEAGEAWLALILAPAAEPRVSWPPPMPLERSWMFERRAAPLANAPGQIAS